MWFIVKKRFLWILRNPVYYIGAILVFLLTHNNCREYLEIQYFQTYSQIDKLQQDHSEDLDIMYGYIPATEAERFQRGLNNLEQDLIEIIGADENQVHDLINYIVENNLEKEATVTLIKDRFPFIANVESYLYAAGASNAMKKVTMEEANAYINNALIKEDFGDYFGRKLSDFLGVNIGFYSIIILAFFYFPDYKKDIYELLHTKPVAEWKYPVAKALGGIMAVGLVAAAVTVIFQLLLFVKGGQTGIPINTSAIWQYVLLCNVPVIFYVSIFYLFIAGLFKNPLPALPILFLQLVYSNMGVTDVNGVFSYVPRPGSILIRFPEVFFETKLSDVLYINQGLLIMVSIVIAAFVIFYWQKKRVW